MYELVLLRIDDVGKNKQAKLVGSELAALTNSSLVQTLGHTALLYKPSNSHRDSVVAAMMHADTKPKR
jgi:RNA-binding protein YhbY